MSNLAEKIKQTTIPLDRVRRDGGTQMRDAISEVTIVTYAEHMQDGAEFPPITVFFDGTEYWLADGFHRCAGYERAGVSSVPADVRTGQRIDAVRYALKANATNGRPRTSDDMRRAYQVAVDSGLCEATDTDGVKSLLECSKRWAMELTKAAKDKAKEERNKRIIELDEQGKTQREIAAEIGCAQGTVNTVISDQKMKSAFSDHEKEEERESQGQSLIDLEAKEVNQKAKEYKRARQAEKAARLESELAKRTRETAIGHLSLEVGSAFEIHKQFKDGSIDLLITDPPYSTDVDDIESFSSWLGLWLPKVADTGRAYVFIGAYPEELRHYLNEAAKESRLTLDNMLVWTYRNTIGPSPKTSYKLNWQACLYFHGPDAPALDCPVMTEQFTVQDVNAPDARTGVRLHAWQKPDELAERLIRHSTAEGQLVVDPFVGTGTFVSAASRLGRDAVGFDTDPAMLEICERRGLEVRHAA